VASFHDPAAGWAGSKGPWWLPSPATLRAVISPKCQNPPHVFPHDTTRLLHQLPCLQEPTEKIIISPLDLKELSSPFLSSEKSATHVRYGCHQEPTEKLIISSFNFKEPASALLIIREA
jgi:hypothetical protein